MPRTFTGVDAVVGAVGTQLGENEWLEITQEQVNQFAEATGDHQWIHVDVDRAASGPYGGTIAHGYLTLSLIARFGSTWIHWWSPVASANWFTCSCVIVTQSLCPRCCPTRPCTPSIPSTVVCAIAVPFPLV